MTNTLNDKFDEVLVELEEHIYLKGTKGLWFFTKLNKCVLSFKYEFAGYKRGTVELIEFHYPVLAPETKEEEYSRRRKENQARQMESGLTYQQYKDNKINYGYR